MPNVEISTNTLDAQIRYTTNGSDVTEESSLYSAPFEIEAGTTVKAKAFKTGMNPSVQSSLASLSKLQTPTVSLSRSGTTITVTIGNTVSGASYRYKVGSAPTSVTDGTEISSTATITSNDATTVYVAGWYYGQYNPSDAASDSVEEYDPTPTLETPSLTFGQISNWSIPLTINNYDSNNTYKATVTNSLSGLMVSDRILTQKTSVFDDTQMGGEVGEVSTSTVVVTASRSGYHSSTGQTSVTFTGLLDNYA